MYNENNQLISVIVPVYNTEKYLEQCINSIINQTFSNLEIILIDDGSTDMSPHICDRFAKDDGRIHVYHTENSGVSKSRNLGIRVATGNYICFVDSDDYIDAIYCETLLNDLRANKAQCSVIGHRRYYQSEDRFVTVSPNQDILMMSGKEALNYAQNSADLWVGYSVNKLFIRSIIVNNNLSFNSDLIFCEDSIFCYQYLELCPRVVRNTKPLYTYRINSESVTSTIFRSKKKLEQYPNVGNEMYIFAQKYPNKLFGKKLCAFCVDLYITYLYYMLVNGFLERNEIKRYGKKIDDILHKHQNISVSKKKILFFKFLKFCPNLISYVLRFKNRS